MKPQIPFRFAYIAQTNTYEYFYKRYIKLIDRTVKLVPVSNEK